VREDGVQALGKRTDCFDVLIDGMLVLWVRELECFGNQDSARFVIEGGRDHVHVDETTVMKCCQMFVA